MNALILVDLQPDFLPGGALAVSDGDAVIAVAARLVVLKGTRFDVIVATQDWHPAGHQSFASSHRGRRPGERIDLHGLPQILWPDHCVQGSVGAALASGFDHACLDRVFQKGADPTVDSYSGFFDNGRRGDTGMATWLRDRGVTDVWVMGLATDYCVKFTALDAVDLGFRTRVVADGCRGVELVAGDCAHAVAEMEAAGVTMVQSVGQDTSL